MSRTFSAVEALDKRIEETLKKQARVAKEFNELFTNKEFGLLEDSRKTLKNLDAAVSGVIVV